MKFHVKAIAMALATMAFGTAQAQDASVGSEFFFQAPAGTSQLTGHVGYKNRVTRGKSAGATDYTVSGLNRLGASYEYGFSDMFSVGADLSYSMLEDDDTTKTEIKGLEDPTLFIKGMMPLEMARLRFGANVGLGFQDAETKADERSVATGQYSIAPYIGMDADVGPGILGARLSYDIRLEGKGDFNGTKADITGGNVLAVTGFYEYILADMLLGGAVNFRSIDKIEAEDNLGQKGTLVNSHSPLGLSAYIRIPMTETAVIVPRLDYDFSASGDQFDKYSDMTLSVAGRFAF